MRLTPKDSPKNQELIARIWLINMALASVSWLFFPDSFVPDLALTQLAIPVSVVATGIFSFFVWKSYREGTFKPEKDAIKEFKKFFFLKRLLMVISIPFLTLLPTILNLNYHFPYIYTASFGEMDNFDDMVVKGTYTLRRSFLTYYELKPKSLNSFFRFTISKEEFDSLPEGPVPGRLVIKKSPLGFIVESIGFSRSVLLPPKPTE